MGKLRKLFSGSGDSGDDSGPARRPPGEIEDKIKRCCRLSKKAGSTFHLAFIFLPRYQRQALHVIYLFCRQVDDAVDEPEAEENQRERLKKLQDNLETGPDSPPLWPALDWVRKNFKIPLKYFKDLLKGARSDVGGQRIETIEELDEYCYRVAGTVGLMTLSVMEAPVKKIRAGALELARAFQITNILRDVGEDFERDRCYLPRNLLEKHDGLTEWQNQNLGPGLLEVCKQLADRAENNYRSAVKIFGRLKKRQQLTLAHMTAAYSYYLAKLKKEKFPLRKNEITINRTVLARLVFDSFRSLLGKPEKCLQIS